MPNTLPENHPNMGLRVLSLDGGVGALSELLILERLMYRTKTERGLDTMPSPWEYFELLVRPVASAHLNLFVPPK
ncbi:hypothetical protein FB451DRAFT_1404246 [Mycena latifolia]|nr:hypothetical protein FB451DRAFT_1404246 [Mycena latifolia]